MKLFEEGNGHNWGDYSKIDKKLLSLLENFREYTGVKIVVTSGFRIRKSPIDKYSYHFDGKAVDVMFPTTSKGLVDLFLNALRFDFKGVGIYKDWQFEGKTLGGLHLDVRDQLHKSLWCAYDVKGVQTYDSLNYVNLKIRGFV